MIRYNETFQQNDTVVEGAFPSIRELYFKIMLSTDREENTLLFDSDADVCSNWVKCNQEFAHNFIRNASLPACPCTFPLAQVKSKVIYDTILDKDVRWVGASGHRDIVYKQGAKACMRSTLAKGTTTLAVQQCCYDNSYTLVTRGRAAGTPMLISPEISQQLHYKVDLLPWIICKGDWTRYLTLLDYDLKIVNAIFAENI